MPGEYRIGQFVRVWYGQDFIREGTIIALNDREGEYLVRFHYGGIPNEWVSASKFC